MFVLRHYAKSGAPNDGGSFPSSVVGRARSAYALAAPTPAYPKKGLEQDGQKIRRGGHQPFMQTALKGAGFLFIVTLAADNGAPDDDAKRDSFKDSFTPEQRQQLGSRGDGVPSPK